MIWVEQPRSSRVAFILPGGCNLALNQFPTHTNDNKTKKKKKKKKKIELQEKPTLSRDGGFSFLVFNNHIENDKRIRKTKKKKKKYNKTLSVLPKGPDAHRQQLQVALQRTVFNVMNLQVREPSV